MKKLFIFGLMAGLLVSSVVNASTLLTGKSHHDIYKNINFVSGTGEKEQLFENKLKVVAMEPMQSFAMGGFIRVMPHNDPNCHMYYYRAKGGMLFGFQTLDFVFGVEGLQVQLNNLTDKPMTIHWNESAIQIDETSSMPLIDHANFTKDGQPEIPPFTIIPPKSAVVAKVFSSANKTRWDKDWRNLPVPISDDGSTRVIITLKVENNGETKFYAFKSPCLDFPADYLATHKATSKENKTVK